MAAFPKIVRLRDSFEKYRKKYGTAREAILYVTIPRKTNRRFVLVDEERDTDTVG